MTSWLVAIIHTGASRFNEHSLLRELDLTSEFFPLSTLYNELIAINGTLYNEQKRWQTMCSLKRETPVFQIILFQKNRSWFSNGENALKMQFL